jgi:hypothetical protein
MFGPNFSLPSRYLHVLQAALFGTTGLTLAMMDLSTMGGQLEASMHNLSVYLTNQMNTSACKSSVTAVLAMPGMCGTLVFHCSSVCVYVWLYRLCAWRTPDVL